MFLISFCLCCFHWLLLLTGGVMMLVIVSPVFWEMWSVYHHQPSSDESSSSRFIIKLVLNIPRYLLHVERLGLVETSFSLAECISQVIVVLCHPSVFFLCHFVNNVRLRSTSCLTLAHYTTQIRRIVQLCPSVYFQYKHFYTILNFWIFQSDWLLWPHIIMS